MKRRWFLLAGVAITALSLTSGGRAKAKRQPNCYKEPGRAYCKGGGGCAFLLAALPAGSLLAGGTLWAFFC